MRAKLIPRFARLAGAFGVLATLLLASVREAGADIYTYVDKDGVLHFTNQAPAHGSKASSPDQGPWKLYAKSKDGEASKPPGWASRPFGGGGAERYTRYDELIREAAGYYQLPEAFVRAVIKVESNYDPTALSIAGAQGLMQLMPQTAARMLVTDSWDPRENIFGGCRLLRVLANDFNGDLDLTIAAYNAGPGAVIRAGGIPNIAETQDYVVKVKQWYRRYRSMNDPLTASIGSPTSSD